VFFKKKNSLSPSKKIDKLVTGIIIWWAVASMIGLSKTDKWKKISKNIWEKSSSVAKKTLSVVWKWMVWVLSIFNKKK
jgi:hypothetical protein